MSIAPLLRSGCLHIGVRSAVLSLLCAVFFVTPGNTTAQDVRTFDEGTRLLNAGDFAGAIDAFDRAESAGYGSSALFHNRGIAHYRLDELGHAIQYLEKALSLEKNNPAIRHSLEIVSSRLIDSYSELPTPVWTRFQRTALGLISISGLLYIGLGMYLLFCAALMLNILGYWKTIWHRRFRFITVVLATLFIFMALTSSIWPAYPQEAVVLVDETALLEQPDLEAESAENIHEGLVVSVVSEGAQWSLVQLPNGARGWILTEMLGAI